MKGGHFMAERVRQRKGRDWRGENGEGEKGRKKMREGEWEKDCIPPKGRLGSATK